MTCPGCGSTVRSDFAFCPRCGSRLAAPSESAPPSASVAPGAAGPAAAASRAEEGDRRLVTVLFADLAGFTALSESLDPEDVRALQSDLFRELSGAVERYDGFVEKFVGVAVMAVFGAPRAHEDDPERALHAALRMHARVAVLSERWAPRVGRPLALHVGVNTGPVVAGTIGADSGGAYAVTGDTVNTAARLQSAAVGGETLLSPSTQQLTKHAFRLVPAGEIAMKGKSQPLAAFRLAGARATRRSGRGLEALGLSASMVGRTAELGQMVAVFDEALLGRARVVSVTGEAGVGKSRLLEEWLATLDASGRLAPVSVRRAACSSLGEQPYAVFAAFFREAYGVSPEDSLEVARQKLASGLAALGGEGEETATIASLLGYVLGVEAADRFRHIEPEQLKRQIFLAMRRLIERRLQQGPLVFTVENLQWADSASVELLQSMLDRLVDQPLMLVVTARVEARTLATTRAVHTTLRLAPLSPLESEALLAAYLGESTAGMPPRLRQLVLDRAGGQPLYLEEILRGLIAAGVLVRGENGWACSAGAAAADVPPTIHGLLLARVDRLPGATRHALQEAAVLGPVFDSALLRQVTGLPAALETALAELRDGDVLEDTSGPVGDEESAPRGHRYRFTNALLQEVAYQSLLLRRRTELHARAGQALEEMVAGRPTRLEDVEALARHWGLGGDRPKAAGYLVTAGDWARGLYANEDAIQHYERALAVLAQSEARADGVSPIRERLGDILAPLGRRAEAIAHYEAVLAAAGTAGDRPTQARLERKLATLSWDAGDRAVAAARLRAGLELMAGHPGHIEWAHLYQEMGRQAFRSGDNEAAVTWSERALAQAERLSAVPVGPDAGSATDRAAEVASAVAQAYNTLGVALARMGRIQGAVGHIEKSVAVAEAHDLLQAACRGYTNLGVLYSTLDPKRAIDTCLRGLETAKKIGDLGLQSRLNTNLAVAYCALTNRCEEQGLTAAQTALDLDRQLGQLDHLAVPLIVLGQIQQCHGDPELARGYYQEALALVEATGEPQFLFPCYDGLATLYLDRDDTERAEEFMRKAQQVCERAGLDPDSFVVLPFLE
jgi:adenylate cyclase